MAAGKIVVTGVAEIDRKLQDLAYREAAKILRQAMRAAMKPMLAAVKAREPRGETGDLSRLVRLRAGKRSRSGFSVVVELDEREFDKYYAAFVEWGTSKMEADPAMHEAYEAQKESVRRDVERRIMAGLNEALR